MTRPRSSSSTDRSSDLAILLAPSGEASSSELERLLAGLGIRVAHTVPLTRDPGAGKRAEVRASIDALARAPDQRVLVVVDRALDPGAQRELEIELDVEVLDRTAVVLRVFEQRARTRLAQLEVELARLAYEIPRVRDDGARRDREGGGGGRGARGHTEVELRKQQLRERSARLEREVERLRASRATQAAARRDVPRVALVGYTNAGKSSLLRALTGSDVLVEDALFATLDTTVRALSPATTPRVLVSDTVGFMRNLPHALVASFHTTLDEARDADLLLLVVDASDPEHREQLRVTREVLETIGATSPTRIVLSKIDRVDPERRASLLRELPGALAISAHDPADVRRLRDAIVAFFARDEEHDVLVVPFTEGRLMAEIRAEAHVVSEHHDEPGTALAVRARPDVLERWRTALPPLPAITTAADLVGAAARYGLRVAPERDALDASGLDFLVLHARDDAGSPWVVRTPRRPDVIASAQREARVLRLVAPSLPAAVPEWRVHARDVIAYRRIEGTPGWRFDDAGALQWAFDPSAPPDAFLDTYARLIASLQSIPVDRIHDAGVRVEAAGDARAELARAMHATRDVLAPSDAVWSRWQRWIDDDASWPAHVALAHGDLHPGHLLLDDASRITGVLDWTEARATDPSLDLAMFFGCYGRDALESVVDRFARAGGVTWPAIVSHTIERWAAYAVVIAEWALRTGDDAVLAHARHHLATITAST
ncbi:GTPase HflX [Sandaracinus amylolyticus]|uniref:GTPase HflX n=1 Tax=Sandaracinus amylolyticus TaxID=927083 RepID=A0A0F6YKB7_9BACT|nr:GTPase HflX [Sandaracinus amylolyticus]AKF09095.1 GTP-binding protein related to HflX [Sandaracinus amylolyticus]